MSSGPPSFTEESGQEIVQNSSGGAPLCVDLDGTLVRADSTWETLTHTFFKAFPRFLKITFGAWRGRAWLKHQIGFPLSAGNLPVNHEVLAFLQREKRAGRKIILVTASDQSVASAIARHFDIFDEAIGSNGKHNLKGTNKAALLIEKFGRGGFDYIGDSSNDIPVWEAARQSLAVQPSRAAAKWISQRPGATTLDPAPDRLGALVRALRPQHWVKNILVFLPLMTAHLFRQPEIWWKLVSFFAAMCLSASAIYVVNDLADLEADRRHADKRRRPLASGSLPIPYAIAIIPVCLVLAALCCIPTGWPGLALLGGYVSATVAYSFSLKRIPVLDILLLSGFYVFRVAAGALLAPVLLSPWLIAFAMFLFLSLAAAKRYVELTNLTETDPRPERGYLREDYPIIATLGVNCACLAVLVLGLYVNSDTFHTLYSGAPIFWLLCPLLLYWLLRIWLMAGRRQLHEDPVIFALRDRVTFLVAAAGAVVFYFAMAGHSK